MNKVVFTKEQEDYIKSNVGKVSMKQISRDLNISYRVISSYVYNVLGKDSKHTFNEFEDFIIKKYYGERPTTWIAKQLNLPINTVYNRARRLGLAGITKTTQED